MGLSGAFMQAAGSHKGEKFEGMLLFATVVDPEIESITGTDIVVTTTKNGESKTETYAELSGETLSISADKNTKIAITGMITECKIGINTTFTRILSTNTALTSLDCSYCSALQELNLSTNTALTSLNCSECSALQELKYPATNENVSMKIAGAITDAAAADGTVYPDSAADYYSTIADAATEKGWNIEQL